MDKQTYIIETNSYSYRNTDGFTEMIIEVLRKELSNKLEDDIKTSVGELLISAYGDEKLKRSITEEIRRLSLENLGEDYGSRTVQEILEENDRLVADSRIIKNLLSIFFCNLDKCNINSTGDVLTYLYNNKDEICKVVGLEKNTSFQ